jgi:hypothetical protein
MGTSSGLEHYRALKRELYLKLDLKQGVLASSFKQRDLDVLLHWIRCIDAKSYMCYEN